MSASLKPSSEPMRPGAPEFLAAFPADSKVVCSIFGCHSDGRLNVRQTASRRRSQHRRSCGLLVGKLTNGQPVVVTKGQVPPDEPTAYALKELGNGFLTIFWLASVPLTASDVNRPRRCRLAWHLSRILRFLDRMEKWPPSSRAAIVWKFSLCRLPAAGLRTQRQSLALLVTEEPWLADLHSGMSRARSGRREIRAHRDERRPCLC